jgi:tricorn protease
LSGPGINIKTGDYLLAVNGVPLNTENLYSYFAKTAGRQIALSVNTIPILKDAKEFTVVPVSSEVNLRQQDWVETNRRKVDKLSNGKLAYVWLPNTGKAANKFQPLLFCPKGQKKEPSLMSDLIGTIADYITDVLSRDLLGYFNNPTGDQQAFTAPNAGLGTKSNDH